MLWFEWIVQKKRTLIERNKQSNAKWKHSQLSMPHIAGCSHLIDFSGFPSFQGFVLCQGETSIDFLFFFGVPQLICKLQCLRARRQSMSNQDTEANWGQSGAYLQSFRSPRSSSLSCVRWWWWWWWSQFQFFLEASWPSLTLTNEKKGPRPARWGKGGMQK